MNSNFTTTTTTTTTASPTPSIGIIHKKKQKMARMDHDEAAIKHLLPMVKSDNTFISTTPKFSHRHRFNGRGSSYTSTSSSSSSGGGGVATVIFTIVAILILLMNRSHNRSIMNEVGDDYNVPFPSFSTSSSISFLRPKKLSLEELTAHFMVYSSNKYGGLMLSSSSSSHFDNLDF